MAHEQGHASKPDINQASKDELMQVSGIGEEMAERIIQNRPYHSAADLDRLFQVGERRIDHIKAVLQVPES